MVPVMVPAAFLTMLVASAAPAHEYNDATMPPSSASGAWTQSYRAGYTDSTGAYAGGSEMLHLEGHDGQLYAANGYWEDTRNCIYGKDLKCRTGWG